jgi:formylmethanofuran dehydrogenase subunit E
MTEQKGKSRDLNEQLRFAADLHGHFGPFLALGVRMGLYGLRKLGVKKGDKELHATVILKYVTPVSCILDGVQSSTRCTVGNSRLTWKNSKDVSAIFQLGRSKRQVEVSVKPSVLQELKLKLEAKPSDEETRQIGLDIASRSDAELFVEKK